MTGLPVCLPTQPNEVLDFAIFTVHAPCQAQVTEEQRCPNLTKVQIIFTDKSVIRLCEHHMKEYLNNTLVINWKV